MPFDGTNTKPSLTLLSEILRAGPEHPLWPRGFVWDYNSCSRCAMGLAWQIWSNLEWRPICSEDMAEAFGMDRTAAHDIFLNAYSVLAMAMPPVGEVPTDEALWQSVTPAHVADAIDRYLATRLAVG